MPKKTVKRCVRPQCMEIYDEAEKNLLVATDPEVFYLLSKNAYAAKDRTKALKYVSIALFLSPENEKYLTFKNKLKKTV